MPNSVAHQSARTHKEAEAIYQLLFRWLRPRAKHPLDLDRFRFTANCFGIHSHTSGITAFLVAFVS